MCFFVGDEGCLSCRVMLDNCYSFAMGKFYNLKDELGSCYGSLWAYVATTIDVAGSVCSSQLGFIWNFGEDEQTIHQFSRIIFHLKIHGFDSGTE